MDGIYLLLGTNLGDRISNLADCRNAIANRIGEVPVVSSIYETAPWGVKKQSAFLNQVIEIETTIAPDKLLTQLLAIEKIMGRVRREKWGTRIIDIDILYYHDQIINTKRLTVPHPEIQNRHFTLAPLVEIIPEVIHPILGKSHLELLEVCHDNLEVMKWQPDTGH